MICTPTDDIDRLAMRLFSHYVLFPSMMAFFDAFDSPRCASCRASRIRSRSTRHPHRHDPGVSDPDVIFVLSRLGLVSARLLWRHLNYAVLAAVVAAALLTPSPEPWNQLVFAAPMVAMYVLGIGIAWLAKPRSGAGAAAHYDSTLGLVAAASVFEQARRRREQTRPDGVR